MFLYEWEFPCFVIYELLQKKHLLYLIDMLENIRIKITIVPILNKK